MADEDNGNGIEMPGLFDITWTTQKKMFALFAVGLLVCMPLDYIDQGFQFGVDIFVGVSNLLIGGLHTVAEFLIEGIVGLIEAFLNAIASLLNSLINAIPGISGTSAFNDSMDFGFDFPSFNPIDSPHINIFSDGQTLIGFILKQFGVSFPW